MPLPLTVREKIIENLQTEFALITVQNGYNTIIKNVYLGYKNLDDVDEYPSISFYFDTDIEKRRIEGRGQFREVDIHLFGHLSADLDEQNVGTLTSQVERFYADIKAFFDRDTSINPKFTSTLNNINNVQITGIIEKKSFVQTQERKCTTGLLLRVQYFEAPSNGVNQNVSALGNSAII